MVGRILIVDDVATNRIVLKVKLTAAGYRPVVAPDGATALAMARAELPELVLLDLMLPDLSGIEVLQRLRADPLTQGLPVLVMSAPADARLRVECFRAGADEVLTRPVDDQTLLARIRSFMRQRAEFAELGPTPAAALPLMGLAEPAAEFTPPARIALITARPETAMRLRRELAPHCADRLIAMTAEEALAEGLRPGSAPDAFLIEADLAVAGGGLRLMSELQSRANTRHAAFAILGTAESGFAPAMAYDLGAHDVAGGEISGSELALRLDRLLRRKRADDRLRASVQDGLRLAVIDPLTGLYNRRYAAARLAAIAEGAAAEGGEFAVMVVDLDRFKSVNDRWGHAAGDAVLVEVARRLGLSLRSGDLLARIGGEEFLAALPATGLTDGRIVAERLCHAVEEAPVQLPCGTRVAVTVSIGLAVGRAPGAEVPLRDTMRDTVDRADRALLAAKSAGRNQVTISRSAA